MSEEVAEAIGWHHNLLQAAIQAHQEGRSHVLLEICGRKPRGRTARIAGRGSPRGSIHSQDPKAFIVRLDAFSLAEWCCGQIGLLLAAEAKISEEGGDG